MLCERDRFMQSEWIWDREWVASLTVLSSRKAFDEKIEIMIRTQRERHSLWQWHVLARIHKPLMPNTKLESTFCFSAKQQILCHRPALQQLKNKCMVSVENGYVTIISNAILCGMCKRKSISHTHKQTNEQMRANALHLFLLTWTHTHTHTTKSVTCLGLADASHSGLLRVSRYLFSDTYRTAEQRRAEKKTFGTIVQIFIFLTFSLTVFCVCVLFFWHFMMRSSEG